MNSIKVPSLDSLELAYLCGVIAGDGCIFHRKSKNEYGLAITGDAKTEIDFYNNIISPLLYSLFKMISVPKYFDKGVSYGIRVYSKELFKFLTSQVGLPQSPKSSIIFIPQIFKKSEELTSSFIRGFADADFCLCLKKRYRTMPYYPVIIGASKSRKIIEEVAEFLARNGITYSLCLDRKQVDKRFSKPTIISHIYIYGNKNLIKWLDLIGFHNPKYLKKVEEWKKIVARRGVSSIWTHGPK